MYPINGTNDSHINDLLSEIHHSAKRSRSDETSHLDGTVFLIETPPKTIFWP